MLALDEGLIGLYLMTKLELGAEMGKVKNGGKG